MREDACGLVRGSRLGDRWRMARLAMSVRVGRTLEHSEPTGPPIQQVAADLRRLNRQRLSGPIEKILRKGALGQEQLLAEVSALMAGYAK